MSLQQLESRKINLKNLFSKKIIRPAEIYSRSPVAVYSYSIVTGATQDVDLLAYLDTRPNEVSLRSDQDVSISFDADERKAFDETIPSATLYASTPLSLTGQYRMVRITNNSGSTATVRIIAKRNIDRVKTV